jgi:hypothetical protein
MKQLAVFSLLYFFQITFAFGQKNRSETKIRNHNLVDTSKIAIIPFDKSKCWFFKENDPTSLASRDLDQIDKLLTLCIFKYNSKKLKIYNQLDKNKIEDKENFERNYIDLSKYKRQYVATINSKGEKEIWVNFFCDTFNSNWKKEILVVFDGGNCFFNVKLNLKKKKYFDLIINGVA